MLFEDFAAQVSIFGYPVDQPWKFRLNSSQTNQ